MNLTEASFFKSIFDSPKNGRSDLFTRGDVEDKILLLSGVPPSKNDPLYNKWYRINKRYTIVTFQTSKLLYLRGKVSSPIPINRRVLPLEDMYNVIKKVHTDRGNPGRDGLYKALSQKYYGVTKSVCQIFTSQCEICQLKRHKKPMKSLVVKPISSSSYLSRGQMDLIDFSTTFLKLTNHLSGSWFIKTTLRNIFVFVL